MTRSDALQLLRSSINNPNADFHEDQWEAIDTLVNYRKKLLVVERTGWGKSSVYFIATRALRNSGFGPTVIISPLLALMRNQIASAERLSINAVTINSANKEEWDKVSVQLLNNEVDALLISPERLSNDAFIESVLMPISEHIGLFVVDEAHCISDWGHDFRPDYQRITQVLKQMPSNMALLATTATANDRVVEDIENQIGNIQTIRGPLIRESLILQTLRLPTQAARLAWMAEHIQQIEGTGIVYTLTKRDTMIVSDWLNKNGISSQAYHGGLSNEEREQLETMLLENKIKVLVATTALGMGYDKPDLSFVIHYQATGSVVSYYQQVGRAGRGIAEARGILLSGSEDYDILAFFRNASFPKESEVNELLSALQDHDGLSAPAIESVTNLSNSQIGKILKYLSVQAQSPIYKVGPKWYRTAIAFEMNHEKINFLSQQRMEEYNELQSYIDSKQCLMSFLRKSLNDKDIEPCGKCANCDPENALSKEFSQKNAINAADFIRHLYLPIFPRKQFLNGAFKVYDFNYKIPVEQQAEEGRTLSRWEDDGWGRSVAANKHSGRFGDELVDAMAEMIAKWRPNPFPTWVTCVPSLNHPKLVPDFAMRLAAKLGLPFIDEISKTRSNAQQKTMQNSYHQCQNLDGAFQVMGHGRSEPVLLVDDIVDSRWTFTVIATLLRQAGSGPVYPVSLATTTNE